MKIVNKGVRIEETPWPIDITPDAERPFRFTDQDWTREALTEVRDALTEALRQLDLMTSAEPEPVLFSVFRLGQVLTGEEELPIGTVVRDADESTWTLGQDSMYRMSDDFRARSLAFIVYHYGTTEIVSLP